MPDRLPWFKCEPGKLLGALAALSKDDGYLYVIVLMRIYENGGPIKEDTSMLARRTGMTRHLVEKSLSSLFEKDKIQRLDDGSIDSRSTHENLYERKKNLLNAKIAGYSSAKKRGQINEGKQRKGLNGRSTAAQRPFNDKDLDINPLTPLNPTVFVAVKTEAWKAWVAYYKKKTWNPPPLNAQGTGWHFPSEFPPETAEPIVLVERKSS